MGSGRSRGLLFISVALLGVAGACQCVDLSQATFDEDGGGASDAGFSRDAASPADARLPLFEDAALEPEDASSAADAQPQPPGLDAQMPPDADLVIGNDGGAMKLCNINGTYYARGGFDPSTPCLVCDPDQSQTSWSPLPAGEVCGVDPGAPCRAGICTDLGDCVPTSNGVACGIGPAAGFCSAGHCSTAVKSCLLAVEADATIDSGHAGTPYGTAPSLIVSPTQSTVLRANFSGCPCAGHWVKDATLKLNASIGSGSVLAASVWRLVRPFDENVVTWTVPWAVPGAKGTWDRATPEVQILPNLACNGQVMIDVTAAARAWAADPTSNQGLLLESQANACIFDSRHGSPPSALPGITINYYN